MTPWPPRRWHRKYRPKNEAPAATVHRVVRIDEAFLERRGRHHDLERGTGRVPPLDRAVLQRPQFVAVERHPRGAVDARGKVIGVVRRQADKRQHLAVAGIQDERRPVEAGVLEPVLRRLLEVVVDRELHTAPFHRGYFLQRANLPAHAVHDDQTLAVLTHEERVVDPLDPRLADDRADSHAVADLRVVGLADVPEQVRRQLVGRILPHVHLLDDDVRQLEVEAPCRERRHLREGGILDHDDGLVARLAHVALDGLAHLIDVDAGDRRKEADRVIKILHVFADDRHVERATVLDEDLAVSVEEDAARRAEGKRPLVIVRRHLLVPRVLNDLQGPETNRKRRKRHGSAHP